MARDTNPTTVQRAKSYIVRRKLPFSVVGILLLLLAFFLGTLAVSARTTPNEELYAPVIENYITAIGEQWSRRELMDHGMYRDLGNVSNDGSFQTTLDTYGYAFVDIDQDGNDELLIGPSGEATSDVVDSYAHDGNGVVQIDVAGQRNACTLVQDNALQNAGLTSWDASGPAMVSYYQESTIADRAPAVRFSLIEDQNTGSYYYSASADLRRADSQTLGRCRISKTQFDSYLNQFLNAPKEPVTYTPFSQYAQNASQR